MGHRLHGHVRLGGLGHLHGFDPFRIPSAFAVQDGAKQAERLLARHAAESGGALPETVAVVLWGTDNLKTEGGPIAQALWLLGAEPRHDSVAHTRDHGTGAPCAEHWSRSATSKASGAGKSACAELSAPSTTACVRGVSTRSRSARGTASS